MYRIELEDLESVVSQCQFEGRKPLDKVMADSVLTALASSVDHEISSSAKSTGDRIAFELNENGKELTFGIVPQTKAVTVVSSTTGLANNDVSACVSKINEEIFERQIKPRLCKEDVRVAGFGTFMRQDDRTVFKPKAFEYLEKS